MVHKSELGLVTRVAIVGGGFGGTVVLANLVERVATGSAIDVFEASGDFGPGLAYGTSDPCHLLNVAAGRMGAFAPDHFLQWLSTPQGLDVAAQFGLRAETTAGAFLPRALYGCYIKDILASALRRAVERHLDVNLRHGKVVDARRSQASLVVLAVEFAGKRQHFDYNALVLATGNRPPQAPKMSAAMRSSKAFAGNPWASLRDDSTAHKLKTLSGKRTVVVLGSGLTAVDAVLSLQSFGFRGRIVALSRHGLLPAPQAVGNTPAWSWTVDPNALPPTALAFFHWLKLETRAAGTGWRRVFEALRPLTQSLWRRLPLGEQRRLLRYHTLWSIHRHRMAPEIADKITDLRASGRLDVIAGKVISLSAGFFGPRLRLRRRGTTRRETIHPALILNCAGPDYELGSDAFLARLLTRGLVKAAPNHLGLEGIDLGGGIFAIGTPLFGSLFETTAVPELREQARIIAEKIAAMTPAVFHHDPSEATRAAL